VLTCEQNGIASLDGAVDLTIKEKDIAEILEARLRVPNKELYSKRKESILKAILRSRYANLFSLLQNHVAEETYLGIVQNKILVDVQGDDVSSGLYGVPPPWLYGVSRFISFVSKCSKHAFRCIQILYQIFTCNILQRKPGEEAPFFEFIQRVCSECESEGGCPVKIKPGCGGFG
jgi:hypothetical protein